MRLYMYCMGTPQRAPAKILSLRGGHLTGEAIRLLVRVYGLLRLAYSGLAMTYFDMIAGAGVQLLPQLYQLHRTHGQNDVLFLHWRPCPVDPL